MSSRIFKRQIPLLITFLTGMLITLDWFVVWEPINIATDNLMSFQIVLIGAMIFQSMINIVMRHSNSIRSNLKEGNKLEVLTSTFLIVSLFAMALVGVVLGSDHPIYTWIFSYMNTPGGYANSANVFLFLALATYRHLRPRSKEATVLFIFAIIALICNIPASLALINGLSGVREFVTNTIVKASYRAVYMGVAIGIILTGIRTLLAMETGYLGRIGSSEEDG